MSGDGVSDRSALSAATARIVAYWTDECARDLDKLMTHFTSDAEVVTPDGAFRGREAVAALYKKSFDAFPRLEVDVKAVFAGDGANCFEYRAVLSDTADHQWLIEGINLMELKNGLISRLRSFEDAPRRLTDAGGSK
ncbi:MAG TPA: nuclear transport factor 2 family protein [Rhizomicrobium sp.]|nr:nuclear transport factor 2 family protein [Rhizomicrobium sp.]